MTDSKTWSGDLNLSDNAFWAQPPARRYAAYRTLRALESPPFFEAEESPFGTQERGYYALLRHADVAEASRNPQLFSSAAGATSIYDLPTEFNEYFGSDLSEEEGFDTVAGLLMKELGRLPRRGESAMIAGFEFRVARADRRRIDALRVVPPRDLVPLAERLPGSES